jgi:hypothetical protein
VKTPPTVSYAHAFPWWILSTGCGLRPEEADAIPRQQINFTEGWVQVIDSKQRNRPRTVYPRPEAMHALEWALENGGEYCGARYPGTRNGILALARLGRICPGQGHATGPGQRPRTGQRYPARDCRGLIRSPDLHPPSPEHAANASSSVRAAAGARHCTDGQHRTPDLFPEPEPDSLRNIHSARPAGSQVRAASQLLQPRTKHSLFRTPPPHSLPPPPPRLPIQMTGLRL